MMTASPTSSIDDKIASMLVSHWRCCGRNTREATNYAYGDDSTTLSIFYQPAAMTYEMFSDIITGEIFLSQCRINENHNFRSMP